MSVADNQVLQVLDLQAELAAMPIPMRDVVDDTMENRENRGFSGRVDDSLRTLAEPALDEIDKQIKSRPPRTRKIIGFGVLTILAAGFIGYQLEWFKKKPPVAPINNVNNVKVDIHNELPFGPWEKLREGMQSKGGARLRNKLPSGSVDEMEKFLNCQRAIPQQELTDRDMAFCLYAAAMLKLNGRDVPDLDRWLDADLLETIEKGVKHILDPTKSAVADALDQSASILVAADLKCADGKFTHAIDLYKRYLALVELIPSFSKTGVFSSDDKDQAIFSAKEKLALAYMDQAENLIRQNQREKAEEMRGEAFKLYAEIAMTKKGTQVVIVPDKNNRPEGWYIHTKAGRPNVSVVLDDTYGYAIRMTNKRSTFLAAELVAVDSPADYRLKWRWKLNKMAPGYRDKETGLSASHPLSVTVAFLTKENKIIAIHYLIDPLEGVGKRWIDKENGNVKLGVAEFELIYPNVVVADSHFPLGEWRECEVDPASDYMEFAKNNPDKFVGTQIPPIRGIVIESICPSGEADGAKISVEGEVADIRLERIAKPNLNKSSESVSDREFSEEGRSRR